VHNYVRLDPFAEPGARPSPSGPDGRERREPSSSTASWSRLEAVARPLWFKRAVFYEVLIRGLRRQQRRRHRRHPRA
jgi:hypothetical protein